MQIICCKCGYVIEPNSKNMCEFCIGSETDIKKDVILEDIIQSCRGCKRYFLPPRSWNECELGSDNLLSILLRKNKSLKEFKIIKSSFLYTEEHSKRLKISVTIQKGEVIDDVEITYKVRNLQCIACQKIEAKQYWSSIVQVRQHIPHKKTLIRLEEMIRSHPSYKQKSNIKTRKDGIDFYFQEKKPALKLVEFVKSRFICKFIKSGRLLSEDTKSNTSKYKFSYSLELSSLCKDDVIKVGPEVANKYGINPINTVLKINTNIKLIDPITNKVSEIDGRNYWGYQSQFEKLREKQDLLKFRVVEIVESRIVDSDYSTITDLYVFQEGKENDIYHCKTHIKNIKEGDKMIGYNIKGTAFEDMSDFKVFLIKKEATKSKSKNKKNKNSAEATKIGQKENINQDENEVVEQEFEHLQF